MGAGDKHVLYDCDVFQRFSVFAVMVSPMKNLLLITGRTNKRDLELRGAVNFQVNFVILTPPLRLHHYFAVWAGGSVLSSRLLAVKIAEQMQSDCFNVIRPQCASDLAKLAGSDFLYTFPFITSVFNFPA